VRQFLSQLNNRLQPIAGPAAQILNPINTGIQAVQAADLGRTRPGLTPAGEALDALYDAMEARADKVKPGAKIKRVGLNQNVPSQDDNILDKMKDVNKYGNSSRTTVPGEYIVDINPNTDRSYLAHELGHVVSDQTDIGHLIRDARNALTSNPNLATAIALSGLGLAGANAVLTPGDEDLATSIVLATAASTPTLIDEALATKNGLAIMDTAGMRANLGQRGRLAGGLLSYAAVPITGALTANLVGNQFDEDPYVDQGLILT